MVDGSYTVRYFVWDIYGNLNWSESVVFDVNTTDHIYPAFSGYWDNNESLVNNGIALFNTTIVNTNGTAFLEINGANYTSINFTLNKYNVSVNLSGGTYNYYWGAYGNGSDGNYNISQVISYTVNSSVIYTEFKNKGQTSNLNGIGNQNKSARLVLDNGINGRIAFNFNVSMNGSYNLDYAVEISHNSIFVNSSYYPSLNLSANLTLSLKYALYTSNTDNLSSLNLKLLFSKPPSPIKYPKI